MTRRRPQRHLDVELLGSAWLRLQGFQALSLGAEPVNLCLDALKHGAVAVDRIDALRLGRSNRLLRLGHVERGFRLHLLNLCLRSSHLYLLLLLLHLLLFGAWPFLQHLKQAIFVAEA